MTLAVQPGYLHNITIEKIDLILTEIANENSNENPVYLYYCESKNDEPREAKTSSVDPSVYGIIFVHQ